MKLNRIFSLFTFYFLLFTFYVTPAHAQVVGSVSNPLPKYSGNEGEGLFVFMGNVLKLMGTIGGIYMIFQLITAGYAYISSAGDPKAAAAAWAQIWQSMLGMVIIASAFVIASVVERFTGIKILTPTIYGP